MLGRYGSMLGAANGRLSFPARRELAERVLLLSSYYRIDPRLLIALVTVESAWRTRATSPVGALGLGQLMPGTAAGLGVDPTETYENLDGTARYLRRLLGKFSQSDERTRNRLALAAYNAGPGAVLKYGGVPPYAETRAYVVNVMSLWERFRTTTPAPASGIAFIRPPEEPVAAAVPRPVAAPVPATVRRSVPHARPRYAPALPSFSVFSHVRAPKLAAVRVPRFAGHRPAEPYPTVIGAAPERRAVVLLGFIRLRRAQSAPAAEATPASEPGVDAIADQAPFLAPPATRITHR
ncbi:MAG: hypothetical protein NVSMB5_14260 [Candidatus Velthaea sp.]